MESALKIPDLRFEQSFRRSLHSNAVSVNSSVKAKRQMAAEQEGPLPVELTPAIVIYTVIKDQLLMPFLQSLAMTTVLMVCKPLLFRIFENGRAFGLRFFSGLGFKRTRYRYQRPT